MLDRSIPGIVNKLEAAISRLLHCRRWEELRGIFFRNGNPSQLRHGVSPVSNRTSEENGDDGKQSQETTQ